MPFLAADGGSLFYERRGSRDGPAVLFLHGLGSSGSDWSLQLADFETRHRVILADLPAHGRSMATGRSLSVDGMAADVAKLLAVLDESPAHVVGLSLGGCVALALALDVPARVRSLTLVNAFARLRPCGARSLGRMLTRGALLAVAPMRIVAAHVARGLFPRPDQRDLYLAAVASLSRTPRRAYAGSVRALLAFDVVSRLGAVTQPTLVVAGARDLTVPLAAKEVLANGIPGARLLVLPDSGHATPIDNPVAFNRAVLEFVAAH